MQNNSMSFAKGLGAGMIAGAAVVTVGRIMMQDKHSIDKGSTKW